MGLSRDFLATEWHPTKNGSLSLNEVSESSARKIWWRCSVDERHEWESRFFSRSKNGSGCPFCKGKSVLPGDSMAEKYPDLLKEWDYEKNTDLDPKTISCKSGKKASWVCKKGHKWVTFIRHRTTGGRNGKGTGCPYCSNHKVGGENSLGVLFPKLLNQWDYKKNHPLCPFEIVSGSHQKVWWKCNKASDHEWQASPLERTIHESGCPCCLGRKVVLSNCIATTHPNVAVEWHPSKNSITPYDVTYSSNKKVWWKCKDNSEHEWCCKVYCRTRGDQCPDCASSKGEKQITNYLKDSNIKFMEQYKLPDCKNIKELPFDFAIFENEKLKCLIEYQGRHHYEAISYWGGTKFFNYIKQNDAIKKEYCEKNNIPLLEISYQEYHSISRIINNFLKKL